MGKSATRNSLAVALVAFAFSVGAQAAALSSEYGWKGTQVSIRFPDKVVLNMPFSVAFEVDGGSLGSSGMIAFLTEVELSPTVELTGAHWAYDFFSSDPGFNFHYQGNLGDAITPIVPLTDAYRFRLRDPYWASFYYGYDSYTWLDGMYEDRVVWTLDNIIIRADTTLSLVLDDGGILGPGVFEESVVVLDPPPAVPLPAAGPLMLLSLGVLGLLRRRVNAVGCG